jgi:hypothetical protein
MSTLQVLEKRNSTYKAALEGHRDGKPIYRIGRWSATKGGLPAQPGDGVEIFKDKTNGKDVMVGRVLSVKNKTKPKDKSPRWVYRVLITNRIRNGVWRGTTYSGSVIF